MIGVRKRYESRTKGEVMRKLTLFAVTALTVVSLGGQALSVQAAPNNIKVLSSGKNHVVIYGGGCDIQSILDRLESCFPNISLPECEQPEQNVPGGSTPETEKPEVDVPEVEQPEDNVPETDAPEVEQPEDNMPESDKPEDNKPGMDAPETEVPDNNTPENAPGNGSTKPEADSQHAFLQEVVNLVNIERAKEGLAPLTMDAKVQAAAQVRAKECEQLFSHTRPNGSSFATALKEQNVSYRSAGENIAWGQRSPQEVMEAWMNSAGHRANIMNPNFTTIGVGYYENAKGTDYWCQLFTR